MEINQSLRPTDFGSRMEQFWEVSGTKIDMIAGSYDNSRASPVCTVDGIYTAGRAWTDWTQGFQYGSAILQFDTTGDERFLELGRTATLDRMTLHVTDFGVHDHGFNIVSTYGNLWRLMNEGGIEEDPRERRLYELALKVSGAVQARRWTEIGGGLGYIYSFNGRHSLFVDTIRSLRSLALAHLLGHV